MAAILLGPVGMRFTGMRPTRGRTMATLRWVMAMSCGRPIRGRRVQSVIRASSEGRTATLNTVIITSRLPRVVLVHQPPAGTRPSRTDLFHACRLQQLPAGATQRTNSQT